jgi:hypothetical protein
MLFLKVEHAKQLDINLPASSDRPHCPRIQQFCGWSRRTTSKIHLVLHLVPAHARACAQRPVMWPECDTRQTLASCRVRRPYVLSIRERQQESYTPPNPVILRLVTWHHELHNKVGAVPSGGQHAPTLRCAVQGALICWELPLLADFTGLQQHQRRRGVQHLHSTSSQGVCLISSSGAQKRSALWLDTWSSIGKDTDAGSSVEVAP